MNKRKEQAAIILRGVLSWHERVSTAQKMNPGKEKEVTDMYAEALREAINCLETRD